MYAHSRREIARCSATEIRTNLKSFPLRRTRTLWHAGGALWLSKLASAYITNCTFEGNVAEGVGEGKWGGGAIIADNNSTMTVQGCVFRGCRADRGSALKLNLNATADISDTLFTLNTGECTIPRTVHAALTRLGASRYKRLKTFSACPHSTIVPRLMARESTAGRTWRWSTLAGVAGRSFDPSY
jgi:hypothetical protein